MKIRAITCDALARPVYWCAAQSPHIVDVELLRFGLHGEPDKLRALLQERVAAAADSGCDAVALAYGLCGKATAGLQAVGVPLAIARAHDCITLFLGSRARYMEQFTTKPGTYWYVQDYIERGRGSNAALSLGAEMETGAKNSYDELVRQHGEDNAAYLMEIMGAWQQHYQRAAFIDMAVGDGANVAAEAETEATRRGWAFERLAGDLTLIRRLLWGEWDDDFLVLQPGQTIAMSYDDGVVRGG